MSDDSISRQWLMECVTEGRIKFDTEKDENRFIHLVRDIAPSVQPEQKITVKNILELMEKDDIVIVTFYAFGIPYASTLKDGIGTVSECLDRLRYACLDAKVFKIESYCAKWIKIHAEIMEDNQ